MFCAKGEDSMGMSIYTMISVRTLGENIAKQKAREEANKAVVPSTNKTNEETIKESKSDNKINLINPGVELTIKDQNIDIPSRTKIYLNSPARRNINQRRRG